MKPLRSALPSSIQRAPYAQTPDESALLNALQRGDQAALTRFVTTHQGRVYRLCLRVMRDEAEAEDMAQETFVRAFKALPSFRGEAELSTWLFRIALNLCRNRVVYLKRRHIDQHVSHEQLQGDHWQLAHSQRAHLTPEQASLQDEEAAHLKRAFDQLSSDHQLLINLRDAEGLSYQALSEVTGWPEGTIKSKLHRARAHLSSLYEALQSTEPHPEPPQTGARDEPQ